MRDTMKSLDTQWRTLVSNQSSRAVAKFGNLKSRGVQKTVYNIRLTILCGIITILVLRGTIGTGFFTFGGGGSEPEPKHDDGLERRALTNPVEDIMKEPETTEKESSFDKDVPFALGPRISNWDQQRAEWLSTHQNVTKNKFGRDRVILISGSASKPCRNSVGDHLLVKSLKNKVDYTRLHDIELFYSMAVVDSQMSSFWVKHPMIRKMMLTHPEAEWIWWMDSDAMFTDMTFEIPFHKYEDHNMIIHGFEDLLFEKNSWVGINAGSFLMRNCQWSLDMLDAWTSMGHPRVAVEYGKRLSEVLLDRPVFDSDDQSVLAYLLVTQTQKWAPKVYLENSYYLHGYWVIIADRYEDIMANNKPGTGDEKWPFVTHFVGCKPCGKEASYGIKRCVLQMERAFNFGDNQILHRYGYQHRTLNSSKEIGRVRVDSADPLGLGLPTVSVP
ncbi:hypothetical protein M758_2G123000 [Ceratodon purpureus]|nr:hypothetical protein M758_2G123000 [Ceratodon purpureus]